MLASAALAALIVGAGCSAGNPPKPGRPSVTTTTVASSTTAPAPAADFYGKRYCEILIVIPGSNPPQAQVWNTYPLNDCPAPAWAALDTAAVAKAHGSPAAIRNGPRYWAMDSIDKVGAENLPTADIGGLQMHLDATVGLSSALAHGNVPYVAHLVDRQAAFTFDTGRQVHELLAPDGSVYVMQTWSQIVDPTLSAADLVALQTRLHLPAGWAYRTRTLTSPLRIDTTSTDARVLQDDLLDSYSLETAPTNPILSAFFGLDHALPQRAAAICPQAPGQDGIVVVVADQLDASGLTPTQFAVVTASGRRAIPLCASLKPATAPGELRTALLIGDLGTAKDPPQRVEVPDGLPTSDPNRHDRYIGAISPPVIPIGEGPPLVYAERVPNPDLGGPPASPDGCPATTLQVVQVTWAGGITRADGAPVTDTDATRYHVTVRASDGSSRVIEPLALAEINDGNNYQELCLDTHDPAVSVHADPASFVSPNHDPNPATTIAVTT